MAKPNWLEELAENWFRMREYITQLHVRVTEFGRRELDLLAFNDEEFLMIDLQTYLGERGSMKAEATSLIKRFKIYDKLLTIPPYKGVSKGKKIRRLFIAGGNVTFRNLIKNSNIEFMPMEGFLDKVLQEIRKHAERKRWPFSPKDISRLLWELIAYEFIK